MNKEKFVNIAVRPVTRAKLRRLAKLKKSNIHFTVETLVEKELGEKILSKKVNIDCQQDIKRDGSVMSMLERTGAVR